MEYPVHVTSATLREGVAKRTGNAYKMVEIQGVLDIDGESQIFRTILPQGSEVPTKGKHMAIFAPRVDSQTMQLGGGIIGLRAVATVPASATKA